MSDWRAVIEPDEIWEGELVTRQVDGIAVLFVNIGGDPVPYDFGGVLVLWLALIDNLRASHLEAELDDVAGYLSPEQAA